ncbi:hypothetical protein BHU09_09545 [Tannerella sp. oral taxon 808]|nr:hypothetical protein BHU09_09545 [Tannerella sp. oral taxon 808]
MTLFLLVTWAILLGVLLRDLYRTEQPTREDVPSDNTSDDASDDGLVGTTRTVLPLEGSVKEAGESACGGTESKDSFAYRNAVAEGEQADEPEVTPEDEAISLLLKEDIEVSTESVTTRELRRLQTAVETPDRLTAEDLDQAKEAAVKLRGADFMEKLSEYASKERERARALDELLRSPSEAPKKSRSNDVEDTAWMAYL